MRIEGQPQCDWVLIDAGDIIVHVFRPEVREFYNLEKMWSAERPSDPPTIDDALRARACRRHASPASSASPACDRLDPGDSPGCRDRSTDHAPHHRRRRPAEGRRERELLERYRDRFEALAKRLGLAPVVWHEIGESRAATRRQALSRRRAPRC